MKVFIHPIMSFSDLFAGLEEFFGLIFMVMVIRMPLRYKTGNVVVAIH